MPTHGVHSTNMNVEISNKRTRDVFIRADVRFTDDDYDETRTFDGYNWVDIKAKIEEHISFLTTSRQELERVPEGDLVVIYEGDKATVVEAAETSELMVVEEVI